MVWRYFHQLIRTDPFHTGFKFHSAWWLDNFTSVTKSPPGGPGTRPKAGWPQPLSPIEQLSNRELEVFQLLGLGHSTRQIADHLHVGFKTVQAYCARIKEKLKLANTNELLREAIRWQESQQSLKKSRGFHPTKYLGPALQIFNVHEQSGMAWDCCIISKVAVAAGNQVNKSVII